MASDNQNPVPGDVNLYDPGFTACPHLASARLRASIPVAKAVGLEGGSAVTVVLSRYQDVIRALQDHEHFSSDVGMGPMAPAPVHVDPPEHARFREVLKSRFSWQSVNRLEPFVRAEVDRLIDAFVAQEACDYQREFAVPLPCSVLLRIMGLPVEHLDQLLSIKDEIIRPNVGQTSADAGRRNGVARANAYFETVLDQRLAHPTDDLLTDLAMTTTEENRRFTRPEILRVCLNLVLGGLDTITASLGCAMAYLARNHDQRTRLIAAMPNVARAARELMRTEAPVTVVPRVALRDVTIAGVEIRAGTLVMALLGSASADESIFADAERVDFDRHPNAHVAFGFGRHRCIGEHLGQMILEVALDGWHRRIPDYAIRKGETLVYNAVIRSPQRLPLEWGARASAPGEVS